MTPSAQGTGVSVPRTLVAYGSDSTRDSNEREFAKLLDEREEARVVQVILLHGTPAFLASALACANAHETGVHELVQMTPHGLTCDIPFGPLAGLRIARCQIDLVERARRAEEREGLDAVGDREEFQAFLKGFRVNHIATRTTNREDSKLRSADIVRLHHVKIAPGRDPLFANAVGAEILLGVRATKG